jgi:hypothetical protein
MAARVLEGWPQGINVEENEMASQIEKLRAGYDKLPEITDDTKHWDDTVAHLVYWAQHEIDLVEEGERDTPMPSASERKLRAFIKKWSAPVSVTA